MYQKHWEVLLVDDEPEVLSVSKLALKRIRGCGLPLNIHTCASKAEAIAFLESAGEFPDLAVAFIDVVMETETAGLELCEYIRGKMNYNSTQIILRTGQPGRAPECEVIDRYDISGYVTKVDATEDRLYLLVRAAIREHYFVRLSTMFISVYTKMIKAANSPESLRAAFDEWLRNNDRDSLGRPLKSTENWVAVFAGEQIAFSIGEYADAQKAAAVRTSMLSVKWMPIGPNGDAYAMTNENLLIRHTPAQGPEMHFLARIGFPLPEFLVPHLYGLTVSLAALSALSMGPAAAQASG
jgi:CheY-like chemotaxis protein